MANTRTRIPSFDSEDEERQFWATHDSTDFIDWSEARRVLLPNLEPSVRQISLRLPESMLDRLKLLAHKNDVPYQSLIKIFLSERLAREAESAPGEEATSVDLVVQTKKSTLMVEAKAGATKSTLEQAARVLKVGKSRYKILHVASKDLAKAVSAMRDVGASGTVKSRSGVARYVYRRKNAKTKAKAS